MPDASKVLEGMYAIDCDSCGEVIAYANTNPRIKDNVYCEDCAIVVASKVEPDDEEDETDEESQSDEGEKEDADN